MRTRALLTNCGVTAALLMSAATATAQTVVQLETAPPPRDDIVVTAPPDATSRQIDKQGVAITRTGDLYRDPLARFSDPVCPGIMGLPVEVAELMVNRIRHDAERVGAPVASGDRCQPNIIVAFVRDGAAEVRKLQKTNGFLFAELPAAEADAVRDEAGPARAWHLTALRTRFGEAETPGLGIGSLKIENRNLGPVRVVTVPSSDSRIFLASRIDISYAVVVIDITAIDRMPVAQIADYAAMRALARTRPVEGGVAPATILSLFDPADRAPPEMTAFDLAYLRSLYSAGSNLPAIAKIGGVNRELRKEEARQEKAGATGG